MGKDLQYLLPRIKISDISAMADNRNSFCSHHMYHLIGPIQSGDVGLLEGNTQQCWAMVTVVYMEDTN